MIYRSPYVTVVNTKAIYLSVLEAGLSLIAVNLPSLWCLLNKVKPESVLRSVRSIISLRSKCSANSLNKNGSHSPLSSLSKNGHTQSSSQDHLAHPETQSIETYAMHNMEDVHHRPQLPLGKIQLTDSISQSAVYVWAPDRTRSISHYRVIVVPAYQCSQLDSSVLVVWNTRERDRDGHCWDRIYVTVI